MAKQQAKEQSAVRTLRKEARALFKSQLAQAEERGYKRGITAALSIIRKKN